MNGSELKKLIEDSKELLNLEVVKRQQRRITKKFAFASIVSDKDIKRVKNLIRQHMG